jgi:hypothetical protein
MPCSHLPPASAHAGYVLLFYHILFTRAGQKGSYSLLAYKSDRSKGLEGVKWVIQKLFFYILPIRPINFPFPEFQAARRVKHLTPAVAGYPLVTLTGVSADAGFPRQRPS